MPVVKDKPDAVPPALPPRPAAGATPTVGVSDVVVVETEDALLITTRRHSQDVGKVVKHLDEKKLNKLV